MCSRLERDELGRLYAVVTTPLPFADVGRAFRVLGNEVSSGPEGTFSFTGIPTG